MKTLSFAMPSETLNRLLARTRAEGYTVTRDSAAGTVVVTCPEGQQAMVAIQHGPGGTWIVRADPAYIRPASEPCSELIS